MFALLVFSIFVGLLIYVSVMHSTNMRQVMAPSFDAFFGVDRANQIPRNSIIFSTAASYVLVAGYLLATLNFISQFGLFTILFPFFNVLSFYIFLRKLGSTKIKDFHTQFSEAFENEKIGNLVLKIVFCAVAFLIFINLAGEIYYSAGVISKLDGGTLSPVLYSLGFIFTSLAIAVIFGATGILRSDGLKLSSMLIIIFVIFIISETGNQDESINYTSTILPRLEFGDLTIICLFILNTMLFPYVSFNPWHLISVDQEQSDRTNSVFSSPFFIGLLAVNAFTVLIIIGTLSFPNFGNSLLGYFAVQDVANQNLIVSLLIAVFIVMALISTLDSQIIGNLYNIALLFKNTSRKLPWIAHVQGARFMLLIVFVFICLAMFVISGTAIDIIGFFGRLGASISVFAPLLLKVIFFSGYSSRKITNKGISLFFALYSVYLFFLFSVDFDKLLWLQLVAIATSTIVSFSGSKRQNV